MGKNNQDLSNGIYVAPSIHIYSIDLENSILTGSGTISIQSSDVQENDWQDGGTSNGEDIWF